MYIQPLRIPGLFLVTPKRHEDARGFFMEVYREDEFMAAGVTDQSFVQENHSSSMRGVLRGLHVQYDPPLGKLIRIIHGAAFVVAVDIRFHSPTRGKWFGVELSAQNKQELFVPAGFASGFCVTGDIAEVEYHYTVHYNPHGEASIRWDDPELRIDWPIKDPIVSERDKQGVSFAEWLAKPEAKLL
jgi:dTDP-4-dehydrorhamnose 3,5-epimerase